MLQAKGDPESSDDDGSAGVDLKWIDGEDIDPRAVRGSYMHACSRSHTQGAPVHIMICRAADYATTHGLPYQAVETDVGCLPVAGEKLSAARQRARMCHCSLPTPFR